MMKVTWTMAIGGRKNDLYGQQFRIKMQIWIVINVLRGATACSVQSVNLVPPEEHGAHPAELPSGR